MEVLKKIHGSEYLAEMGGATGSNANKIARYLGSINWIGEEYKSVKLGFNAFPTGYLDHEENRFLLKESATWWTSGFSFENPTFMRMDKVWFGEGISDSDDYHAIRCVKDNSKE